MLKDSQTPCLSKCATFNSAKHIFGQAQLFQNMNPKSVCLLGTTAGVIRVKLGKVGPDGTMLSKKVPKSNLKI